MRASCGSASGGNVSQAKTVQPDQCPLYAVRPLTSTPVPELRIYKLWDQPVGPHPVGMFEVNVFTPAQFGAFVAFLAIWRGPLSALIHPNVIPADGESKAAVELRDHSERATWMGKPLPLDYTMFYKAMEAEKSGLGRTA